MLGQVRKFLKMEYEGYGFYRVVENGKLSFPLVLLRYTLPAVVSHYSGSLICRLRGHDWVDESYGGPDSGCMAGHCRRCDLSFHNILY